MTDMQIYDMIEEVDINDTGNLSFEEYTLLMKFQYQKHKK